MDEMNLFEHHDLQEDWNRGKLKRNWFYSLKTLKLENCENLSCAIPYNILLCLKSLKDLEVQNCNKVEMIFGKKLDEGTEAISSQLKNLTLEGLSELKHVWEKYQGNHIFQNLQQVSVSNCESLQTLFPVALARTLEKLETLEIGACNNLLEIIGKEDVAAGGTENFEFLCLTSLYFCDLPELSYFYPLMFTVKWKLHELLVMNCPKFELFQNERLEGAGECSSTSINRQPLFSDIKVRNVEYLISNCLFVLFFPSSNSEPFFWFYFTLLGHFYPGGFRCSWETFLKVNIRRYQIFMFKRNFHLLYG